MDQYNQIEEINKTMGYCNVGMLCLLLCVFVSLDIILYPFQLFQRGRLQETASGLFNLLWQILFSIMVTIIFRKKEVPYGII